MAEAALYGGLTALIFTLWPLAKASETRATSLFRDGIESGRALPAPGVLLLIATLVGALLYAAIWFSGNARLTLWTAGGIAGALLLLTIAAVAVRWLARWSRRTARGKPALAWALAAISGPGSTATPVVLSLGLGLSVLAAVGQIVGNQVGARLTRQAVSPHQRYIVVKERCKSSFAALVGDLRDPLFQGVQLPLFMFWCHRRVTFA